MRAEHTGAMVWLHAEYETTDGGFTWIIIYRAATLNSKPYIPGKNYMPILSTRDNGAHQAWHSRPVFNPREYVPDMFDYVMPIKRTRIEWRLTEQEQLDSLT